MPKAEPHFDCAALCANVLTQEIGLRISTNNPEGFKRVLYKHMRLRPEHKIHIYQAADTPNALLLLNQAGAHAQPEASPPAPPLPPHLLPNKDPFPYEQS